MLPLMETLRSFKGNLEEILGLPGKGRVWEGMYTDTSILDCGLNVGKVLARSSLIVDEGSAVIRVPLSCGVLKVC